MLGDYLFYIGTFGIPSMGFCILIGTIASLFLCYYARRFSPLDWDSEILDGGTAHDAGLSTCRFPEKPHILGNMDHQMPLFPDCPVLTDVDDLDHGATSYRDGDVSDLLAELISLQPDILGFEIVEIMYIRVQEELRRRIGFSCDQCFNDRNIVRGSWRRAQGHRPWAPARRCRLQTAEYPCPR